MHLSFILGMLVVVAILIVAIVLFLAKNDTKNRKRYIINHIKIPQKGFT